MTSDVPCSPPSRHSGRGRLLRRGGRVAEALRASARSIPPRGGRHMPGSVIVAGARTPIGKMSGVFADLTAMDLGGIAIKAALERAGVTPRGGLRVHGPGPPRRAGPDPRPPGRRQGRDPDDGAGTTINKVCLSGFNASTWPT